MISYQINGDAYLDFYGVRNLITIPKSSLIKLLSKNEAAVTKYMYKGYKLYRHLDIMEIRKNYLDSKKKPQDEAANAGLTNTADKKESLTTNDN
jgi:hypothetical protein